MTDVPLREHVEGLVSDQDEKVRLALDSADKLEQERIQRLADSVAALEVRVAQAMQASGTAVLKAEAAAEKRFESVNEFRGQMADQQSTFMPRELAEAQISDLKSRLDKMQGSTIGSQQFIAYAIAAAGIALAVYANAQ